MDLLDFIILAFAIAAMDNGYRRGFSLSAFAYGGLVAGTALGAFLAPPFKRFLAAGAGLDALVAVGVLVLFASVGSSLGYAFGEPIRLRLLRDRRRSEVDSAAGAAFSVLTVLATAWFLGFAFDRVPVALVTEQIQGSGILRTLDGSFPRPPGFLASAEQILSDVPYPKVFEGLTHPTPGPVQVDSSLVNDPAVLATAKLTVRVSGFGCGGEVFGSGYPVSGDYIVSNAHVVAGTAEPHRISTPDGRFLRARVVLFDPERDVSILLVPGLSLRTPASAAGTRGTTGATIGYPGGGDETVKPAAVRGEVTATGRDIYGDSTVTREIYVL